MTPPLRRADFPRVPRNYSRPAIEPVAKGRVRPGATMDGSTARRSIQAGFAQALDIDGPIRLSNDRVILLDPLNRESGLQALRLRQRMNRGLALPIEAAAAASVRQAEPKCGRFATQRRWKSAASAKRPPMKYKARCTTGTAPAAGRAD